MIMRYPAGLYLVMLNERAVMDYNNEVYCCEDPSELADAMDTAFLDYDSAFERADKLGGKVVELVLKEVTK